MAHTITESMLRSIIRESIITERMVRKTLHKMLEAMDVDDATVLSYVETGTPKDYYIVRSKRDGLYGVAISSDGYSIDSVVIPMEYDYIEDFSEYDDSGVVLLWKNGRCNLMDVNDGELRLSRCVDFIDMGNNDRWVAYIFPDGKNPYEGLDCKRRDMWGGIEESDVPAGTYYSYIDPTDYRSDSKWMIKS